MKKSTIKHSKFIIIFLGFNLILWMVQAFYKIYYQNSFQNVFWISSLGYLLTIFSIYFKRSFLFSSMFCSIFFFECLWSFSLISQFLIGNNIYSITSYMFLPTTSYMDRIISLYHLFIIPTLIVGLYQFKKIHRYGWFGAFIFLLFLGYVAYFLPHGWSNINCVFSETVGMCKVFFSFLYNYYRPVGILLATILMLFFILIPTNILFIFILKKIYKT